MDSSNSSGEPDSSATCRDDIIAMFSAAGYHRVRTTNIDDYNRIVGGIVWAITRYDDVEVAANILYVESEEDNIKFRTEQCEKIIEALTAIKCQYQLSAHQIFGLDYVALKSVVQWILRRVLAQNMGIDTKNKYITDWFTMDHVATEADALKEYRRRLRRSNELDRKSSTNRYMKRFDNSIIFDLTMDAKCTIAEYLDYSKTGESKYLGFKEEEEKAKQGIVGEEGGDDKVEGNLQEASTKKHVPTSTVREMMDQLSVTVFNESNPKDKETAFEVCDLIDDFNIPQRLAALENRLVDEAAAFYRAKKDHEELAEKYTSIMKPVEDSDKIYRDLEQMSEIMKTFQDTQNRAQELRTHVLKDLEKCRRYEEILRRNVDEHGNIQKYCAHKREIMEQFAEKTKLVADSVRDVLTLQFRLDRILNATLSSHYRKRNMERIQNSEDLTRETKSAVIDYNVTIDILTFSAKINGFINQVEQSLMAEPATQEYRDSFVAYMNDVRTQLGEYHWKAKLTQDKTVVEKTTLSHLRSAIRLKEREVAYTTGEMKKLLRLNKVLQKTALQLAEIEEKSPEFQCSEAKKAANP